MKMKHRILFSIFGALLVSFGIALATHLLSLNGWIKAIGHVTSVSFGNDEHWFGFEYEINGKIYEKQVKDNMNLYFRTTPLPSLGLMEFYYNPSDPSSIRLDGEYMSTMFIYGIGIATCFIALTGIDFYLDDDQENITKKKKSGN